MKGSQPVFVALTKFVPPSITLAGTQTHKGQYAKKNRWCIHVTITSEVLIYMQMAAVNVFLTQAGDVSSRPQHDEFTGLAVRSVDVSYTSGISGLEEDLQKPLTAAFVTDRSEGSCWFMPCFSDLSLKDAEFYGEEVVSRSKPLEVGDCVRFGSTYAGGSSPYCTILERVPVHILVNGMKHNADSADADKCCLEYLPGNHSFKDDRNGSNYTAYERDTSICGPTLLDAIDGNLRAPSAGTNLDYGICRRYLDGTATTATDFDMHKYYQIRTDNGGRSGEYRVLRDSIGRAGRDTPFALTNAQLPTASGSPFATTNTRNNPLGPGWLSWHKTQARLSTQVGGGVTKYTLLLSTANKDKVVPGMYVIIQEQRSDGTGTDKWHHHNCRVTTVLANDSADANFGNYPYVAFLDKTPYQGRNPTVWTAAGQDYDVYFVNLSADDACYAYRINRQLNLTTVTGRFADPRHEFEVTQKNLYKGGIMVPGSFDAETSNERFKKLLTYAALSPTDVGALQATNVHRYDDFHEIGFDSTSIVQSKIDQKKTFDSIPFSRSKIIDLERCYYPCYRQRPLTDRLPDVANPLAVTLDPDLRLIYRIELVNYSIFGKRRIEKEDAAEILDDEYLILKFKELNGDVISNNPHADRAFAILSVGGDLSTSDTVGALEYNQQYNSHTRIAVDLNPPRKLQTLTMECTSCNGEPAHLGRLHVWLKCYTQPVM